jgi:hypothetical protein
MAMSGEKPWRSLGRNRWPLTYEHRSDTLRPRSAHRLSVAEAGRWEVDQVIVDLDQCSSGCLSTRLTTDRAVPAPHHHLAKGESGRLRFGRLRYWRAVRRGSVGRRQQAARVAHSGDLGETRRSKGKSTVARTRYGIGGGCPNALASAGALASGAAAA